ncbi:aspartic proteinase CDR1-like [Mercurialis annua]|uniref:aspartic proteinase CDR1-like n=1 Tax=Mercurialis annua TaxID=3986 RepID=UPI0021603B67|nr:aspartic proteinase CDR1-like [Mercurialis annua]
MAFLKLFFIVTICLSNLGFLINAHPGFSLDLINRESPDSPFYNPDETPAQRLAKAMNRSLDRFHHLDSVQFRDHLNTNVQSEIAFYQGEYLVKIAIGVPPTTIIAIADTGSDLIWTQCLPCNKCLQQDAPPYDPSKSITYRTINCNSTKCKNIPATHCSFDGTSTCKYAINYGDTSFTNGDMACDTITLGSSAGLHILLPKAIIGCGHDNGGKTFTSKVSGIVGLGGGSISLVSQLQPLTGGSKFSYCLVPYTSAETSNSSKLSFGAMATVAGDGVVVTPLFPRAQKTFYYVKLEAISVDAKRIEFFGLKPTGNQQNGNMIVDTGTTMTLLPGPLFAELETEVENVVRGKRFEVASGFPKICYYADSIVKLPQITLHFTGADLVLSSYNSFIDAQENVLCFTFNPLDIGVDFAILGNMAQTNFLIGYDQQKQTVSFKKTDCAIH